MKKEKIDPSDKRFFKFLYQQIEDQKQRTSLPSEENWVNQDQFTKKYQIQIALLFWKFVRQEMKKETLQKKRSFLSSFLNNKIAIENVYVRTVSKIESLPTSVWRKILWRENMDFMSYESFLRRLSTEQIEAIKDNYNDLFSAKPVIPRVFKKSLRDRIKMLFGAITVSKLLNEEQNISLHKQTKGAYAFDLLGLDFGFSLYPKGDDNDTKITNKKFTRFLSVKEHINDFVVNLEDGKYWWLYKTARSNYAFNPDAEVEIKSHICPGFWMTLFLHFIFWIVSPIALMVSGAVITKVGFSNGAFLIPQIFALPMILWVVSAIIRTIIVFFSKRTKVLQIMFYIALIPFLGYGALNIVKGTIFVASAIVVFLLPIIGTLLTTLLCLTAIFYLFFFFTCVTRKKGLFEYDDVPSFVRFILHLSVAVPILMLFDKYVLKHILVLIVKISNSIWEWYTYNLLISNWFILAVLFTVVFIYFFNLFLTNEKIFARYGRFFMRLAEGFLIFTVVIFAIAFYKIGNFYYENFGILPLLYVSVIFIFFGLAIYMFDEVNQKNIGERIKAFDFATKINDSMGSFEFKGFVASMLKSKWLQSMSVEDRWDAADSIRSLAYFFYPDSETFRVNFTEAMLAKGSLDIIDIFTSKRGDIKDYTRGKLEERMRMLRMIISGISTEKAFKVIEENRSATERLSQKVSDIGKKIIIPFVFAGNKIAYLAKRVKQIFLTLFDLWDFMNKLCPFISKTKILD